MIRVAVVLFVLSVFSRGGVNGFRVMGGDVQFLPFNKTLILQLQLDTPQEGKREGGGGLSHTREFTNEEQIGLATHNMFRQVHGVPMMTLDRKMCDQAKAYAQKLAQVGTLRHSPDAERDGQGENLAMGCSSSKAVAMDEAVKNWYNEVCNPGYNFNGQGFSGGTGHFTQVVWKASTILGIGRAESTRNGMKCAYIVGRYKLAGNFMGRYAENVQKGSFDEAIYCNSLQDQSSLKEQEQAMTADTTKSTVNVPVKQTGPDNNEFQNQQY